MSNEQQFMERLRTALRIPGGGDRSKSMHPELFATSDKKAVREKIAGRNQNEKEQLTEILEENCETLHAELHKAETMQEAADIVVEVIRRKDPEFSHNRHVALHDHPDINELQLWKRFPRESVTLHTTFAADTDAREKTLASYIGITAPSVAVADSATLMQLTSPGCPRSTSLVPSIHIALVRTSNLVANLEEGYALLEKMAPKESFVFISGPSKTADIEAHLVLGAHGPKELHLVLVNDCVKESAKEVVAEAKEEIESEDPQLQERKDEEEQSAVMADREEEAVSR